MKVSYFWKLNIGYIFFDGVEIKYILIDELEFDLFVKFLE